MKRRVVALVGLAAVLALGGACSGGESDDSFSLDGQLEDVVATYRFVEANLVLAEQIVCYCGCGETLEHRHLRDCFYTDDGRPDSHASGCGVCLAQAIEVERMQGEGMDVASIASEIDERFEQTGPPTRAR